MNFLRTISKLLCCLIAAWLATPSQAQELQITGIGLSGHHILRDTLVVNNDHVYGIISFTREPGMNVEGLALDEDDFNQILVHYYTSSFPVGIPGSTVTESIIADSTVVDTISSPNTLRFQFQLLTQPDVGMHSLQVEAAIFGRDTSNFLQISEHRTSRLPVSGVPTVLNPVDALHVTFLRFHDIFVGAPEIFSPRDSAVITRGLEVRFSLPEQALARTLILTFAAEDTALHEPDRLIYLHDRTPGSDRTVNLNIGNLSASQDIDSVSGPPSLTHQTIYRLVLSYTDLDSNIAVPDSVHALLVDIFTETPDLLLPSDGTESPETEIPVAFEIYEFASTVQLIFTLDSLSPAEDDRAPHELTLASQFNSLQLYVFDLDGTNIGTNNPIIANNNNGPEDALVSQALYDVTVSYRDTVGNAPGEDTNLRYMFPRDLATLRPTILDPDSTTREDETFWVQFSLPEEALAGSVRIIFRAVGQPTDPGAPHFITFGNLVASGVHGIMLNARNFIYSDLVTNVTGSGTEEQNNTLVHNGHYRMELQYRDALGNSLNADTLDFAIFDIATDAPEILAPLPGDSLDRTGTIVRFNQFESALPASLRLIFTQTGGPEPDTLSPHTLYISDDSAGVSKEIVLLPGFLSNSTGVDSVQNNGSLIPLAIYRMTLQYQDTLGNPPASTFIDGLHMITGAAVFAEGRNFNISADPGEQTVAFRLNLRTFVGTSTLRGLRFLNDGALLQSDVIWDETHLWASVDTLFDPQSDTQIASLSDWEVNDLIFTNFGYGLSELDVNIFAVLSFSDSADVMHSVNLLLLNDESVDCGGDPVFAQAWPIGQVEVPLPVFITSFVVDQDTAFGSLRLMWHVASELNNEGFNVLRRADGEQEFTTIASFTNTPSLAGRGTVPTGQTYTFTDQNLTPGITYTYRLEAVASTGFHEVLLDFEASNTPRIPPNDFVLSSAYPNPFNQDVTLEYVVPRSAVVELFIYDINGRLVRSLVRALQAASLYKAHWDSRDDQGFSVPSGIYFYRLRAGGTFDKTRKLLLIR